MKIAIIGSRSIKDPKVLDVIDKYLSVYVGKNLTLLMGDAKGVDELTQHYADAHNLDVVKFLPYHLLDNKTEFDSRHFFIRTKQLVDNADRVLAIWDTKSNGTEYAIKYAQKQGKPTTIVKL